jgi:23S rRNA (uracil1939-C5)-methyltransferase
VLRIPPENWDVPPDSFFQNNFFLLPKLVETVRGFLRDGGAKHLVDLYCGVGFFGIELADLVESFVGVEYDRLAIKAAQKNLASRKINNGEFISATVEEVLPELLKKFSPEKTSVILDPPRKGCLPETLRLLRETRPARDLNILCADGVFELARVQPLDMFPQTQHVECVADLRAGQSNLAKPENMDSTV